MPLSTPSLPPQVQHAPVAFVENRGQAPSSVRYESNSLGYQLEITARGAVIRKGKAAASLHFPGARQPSLAPARPLEARYHFYRGKTRHEQLPMFGEVRQNGLYPGIDAVYYGSQSNLEYDFIVHPHADPSRIRIRFDGASRVTLRNDGALSIEANGQRWQQKPPLAFQQSGQAYHRVEARYRLSPSGEITFALGPYDPAKTLTIDPILAPFADTAAAGIADPLQLAIDSQNNIYAAGTIDIAKFNSQGTLLYQFHIADDGEEQLLQSIAVAADGSLIAGGITESRDLPTSSNVFQPNKDIRTCFPYIGAVDCRLEMKRADGFVLKLRPNGTLHWATYLGAGDRDNVLAVAPGPSGTVYAAGETTSNFFPTKNEFQGCGAFPSNAFLTVLRADGTDINYSTCLHPTVNIGTKFSRAYGLAVDSTGNAYISGQAKAGLGDFPAKGASGAAPFQAQSAGGIDGFIARFNPALAGESSLVYSTLIGGSADDRLDALTLDAANVACAAGSSRSANYPKLVPPGTTANTFRGPRDLVVTCLTPDGATLAFSNVYGIQVPEADAILQLPVQFIHRDRKGGLHVTSRQSGSFIPVNPFDNAVSPNRSAYLRLRAGTRSVQTLSHLVEGTGSVVTDSGTIPFFGTTTVIRKSVDVCATDITSSVQVIQGNIVFDIATGRFRQTINLRSIGFQAIPAGARLVFTELPAGVDVFNPAGDTLCFAPAGSPFVTLPAIPLPVGGVATITVEFTSTGAGVFYIPKVAAPGNDI